MTGKKERLVQYWVSDREKEMIDALCERLGKKRPEMLRGLISEKFLKVFPKYAQKRYEEPVLPSEQITPEQAVEMSTGSVRNVEGVPYAVWKTGPSTESRVPMSLIGQGEWTFEKLMEKYAGK